MSKLDFKVAQRAFAEAHEERRSPDFPRFELAVWTKAAERLVQEGQLELAAFAVRRLKEQWPTLEWARNVHRLLEMTPALDPAAPPFRNDPSGGAQVIHRPGAETVILVFSGGNQAVGMPLPMLHQWLSRWPVSLVYLRDRKSLGYLAGVEPFGQDLAATLQALRSLIEELGATRIVCYGLSYGGYGALRYGLELGAAAVVTLSGLVNMDPAFNTGLHYTETARRLNEAFPDETLDLRELHLASSNPPAVFAAYAEHNWDDRIHAEHLAGLDGVVLIQAPGTKTHNTTVELILKGQYDDLMTDALGLPLPRH